MSKAASSVLGRSAPAKTRFVRSTRVCSHEHRLVRSAQATPETFCTPPKRYRARNHHIEVALRVRAGDIIAAPTWPPRPVPRDEVWLRAPLNLAPTLPARSAWVRRPAPGNSIFGLPLRIPSLEDTAATNRRACSLVPRQLSEAASKTCVSAIREERCREGLWECRRRAVSQPPTPTVDTTAVLEVRCGKAKNSPVHAAYGLCARRPVLKNLVGRGGGNVNRGARIQHRKISNVTTPRERRAN